MSVKEYEVLKGHSAGPQFITRRPTRWGWLGVLREVCYIEQYDEREVLFGGNGNYVIAPMMKCQRYGWGRRALSLAHWRAAQDPNESCFSNRFSWYYRGTRMNGRPMAYREAKLAAKEHLEGLIPSQAA